MKRSANNTPNRRRLSTSSIPKCRDDGQNHERKRKCNVHRLALGAAVFGLFSGITAVSARDIEYCSDLNTGSDSSEMASNFQSNGLCYDHCNTGKYAFAILQGTSCWCSYYVPGFESSGCDEKCQGFPSDLCGNTKKNLYGYMVLPNKPSGTMGAETTVSTTSHDPITSTVTAEGPTQTVIITKTSITTKSTKPATTLSTKPHKTTPSPTVSVVTTVLNGIKTVVVSSTGSAEPQSTAGASTSEGNFFSNAGRAAGLIVGLILALFLILAGVLFYRRRQIKRRGGFYGDGSTGSGIISAGGAGIFSSSRRRSRSMSTLGLIGEKGLPTLSTPPTGLSTASVPPQTAGETTAQVGAVYDQRLDPSSLFMRFDHQTGSSRMSVRSLRDDQDYSRRVLRLANPDD